MRQHPQAFPDRPHLFIEAELVGVRRIGGQEKNLDHPDPPFENPYATDFVGNGAWATVSFYGVITLKPRSRTYSIYHRPPTLPSRRSCKDGQPGKVDSAY